jgi:hypothetical protein
MLDCDSIAVAKVAHCFEASSLTQPARHQMLRARRTARFLSHALVMIIKLKTKPLVKKEESPAPVASTSTAHVKDEPMPAAVSMGAAPAEPGKKKKRLLAGLDMGLVEEGGRSTKRRAVEAVANTQVSEHCRACVMALICCVHRRTLGRSPTRSRKTSARRKSSPMASDCGRWSATLQTGARRFLL